MSHTLPQRENVPRSMASSNLGVRLRLHVVRPARPQDSRLLSPTLPTILRATSSRHHLQMRAGPTTFPSPVRPSSCTVSLHTRLTRRLARPQVRPAITHTTNHRLSCLRSCPQSCPLRPGTSPPTAAHPTTATAIVPQPKTLAGATRSPRQDVRPRPLDLFSSIPANTGPCARTDAPPERDRRHSTQFHNPAPAPAPTNAPIYPQGYPAVPAAAPAPVHASYRPPRERDFAYEPAVGAAVPGGRHSHHRDRSGGGAGGDHGHGQHRDRSDRTRGGYAAEGEGTRRGWRGW